MRRILMLIFTVLLALQTGLLMGCQEGSEADDAADEAGEAMEEAAEEMGEAVEDVGEDMQ